MINSNGTLLSDDILECLANNKPRRVNLSLYGSSNKVYEDLCRNPKGFDQVIDCIERLQSHKIDIRFNMALTPWNKEDFPNMIRVAQKYDIPVSIANYIFPAQRRNLTSEEAEKHRFSPELTVQYNIDISETYKNAEEIFRNAKIKLEKVNSFKDLPEQKAGFWCRGGNSYFWVSWDWKLLPCGMIQYPSVPIQAEIFGENWKQLRNEMQKIMLSSECYSCSKRDICQTCAASMMTETGSYQKKPEHHCRMTDATIALSKKIVEEYEHD